jgi:hypothetical protein
MDRAAQVGPDLSALAVGNRITPSAATEAELNFSGATPETAVTQPYTKEEFEALKEKARASAPTLGEQAQYLKENLAKRNAEVEAANAPPPTDLELPEPEPTAAAEEVKPEAKPEEEVKTPEAKPLTPAELRAQRIEELLGKIPEAEAKRDAREAELSLQAKLDADLAVAKAKGDQIDAWNEFKKAKEDKGSYFSRLSTPRKVGTLISLALGSFAAGWKGIPNVALKMYDDAVNEDLERQRADQNSAYNKWVQAGGSVKDAESMVKAMAERAFAADIAAAGRDSLNLKAQLEALKVSDAMERQAMVTMSTVNRNLAQTKSAEITAQEAPKRTAIMEAESKRKGKKDQETWEQARDEYQRKLAADKERIRKNNIDAGMDAKRVKQKDRELDLQELNNLLKYDEAMGKQEAEAAKRKAEDDERLLNVNGFGVPVAQKIEKRKVQESLEGYEEFIKIATNVRDLLKEHPFKSHVPLTQENQVAVERLARLLERYPKAERFNRPLNLTASTVIRGGLQDPASIGAGLFGNPVAIMDDILEDAKWARAGLIEHYAEPTAGGKAAAAQAIQSLGDLSSDASLGARKAP